MKLGYIDCMNEARAELQALAREKSTYIDRREAAVRRALDEGMTLVEIARILGMTPQGLIKARKKQDR